MGDKPIKVLLVEDNPGDARLIREFLFEALGESFEIEIANKLFEGLKLLIASTFDIVLLDLSLPDSTGLDTLNKTNSSAPQVPIIVLTGLDDDVLAVEAVRGGAQDYLVKGQISAELLCRTIHYSIERKQSEEVIAESEKRYRTILESMKEGYYEVDIKGNLTFFNDSLCSILGYSQDELMGLNHRSFIDKKSIKKTYRAFNEVYAKGKSVTAFDLEIERKDKRMKFLEISISLKKNINDEVIGFQGIARDVSERKLADKEKKKLQVRLLQAEKMEAIGTLAGGVAHDLNNVLSGLIGYPDLLLMDMEEDNPYRKKILTIKKSGEKAASIVQDLLTLARRGVPVAEVVRLDTIVREYLMSPEFDRLKFFHPKVQVKTNLENNLLNILGSPVHLSKAMMNLVSNAAESMPDGGDILISAENRNIDSPIRGYDDLKEGDYVTLTVTDTGVGMTSEEMEKIFEPFYTKKVMGRSGTGLGMAVVWGTVKDHNGYIDIKSTAGEGTQFTLYFPATRKEQSKIQNDLPIKEYMGKGESILVVDDLKDQREIAYAILSELAYSVTTVSSGEKAIEYVKNNSVDLLFLDMIMDPGIDGLDTYKKILEFHPGQKALIASGFSETDQVKEAKKLGAGQYIRKPYTLEEVAIAIRMELNK